MTEFVWCWDEHEWFDITNLGDSETHELCGNCGATRTRPFTWLPDFTPPPVAA